MLPLLKVSAEIAVPLPSAGAAVSAKARLWWHGTVLPRSSRGWHASVLGHMDLSTQQLRNVAPNFFQEEGWESMRERTEDRRDDLL